MSSDLLGEANNRQQVCLGPSTSPADWRHLLEGICRLLHVLFGVEVHCQDDRTVTGEGLDDFWVGAGLHEVRDVADTKTVEVKDTSSVSKGIPAASRSNATASLQLCKAKRVVATQRLCRKNDLELRIIHPI
jgi:hypothetical protein